ncbi:hypothetical protein FB45DRAFT_1023837 [Roridomyces roridus]|uniref:Uncharacterized protein n=1 Tax=Roridomyces roridus TaxID=1738132 RepID=A0AAD7C529_9AGAR|nr:hypothetical protein FB45DRAFT_1023837 [Roridomyces roridus]
MPSTDSSSSQESSLAASPPTSHQPLSTAPETRAQRKKRLEDQRCGIVNRMRETVESVDDPYEREALRAPFRIQLAQFDESLTKEDQDALAPTREDRQAMEAQLIAFGFDV